MRKLIFSSISCIESLFTLKQNLLFTKSTLQNKAAQQRLQWFGHRIMLLSSYLAGVQYKFIMNEQIQRVTTDRISLNALYARLKGLKGKRSKYK